MLPWSLLILGVHVFELDPVKQEATVQPGGLLARRTQAQDWTLERLEDRAYDVQAVMPEVERWWIGKKTPKTFRSRKGA